MYSGQFAKSSWPVLCCFSQKLCAALVAAPPVGPFSPPDTPQAASVAASAVRPPAWRNPRRLTRDCVSPRTRSAGGRSMGNSGIGILPSRCGRSRRRGSGRTVDERQRVLGPPGQPDVLIALGDVVRVGRVL